jgi:hypothetical protein
VKNVKVGIMVSLVFYWHFDNIILFSLLFIYEMHTYEFIIYVNIRILM